MPNQKLQSKNKRLPLIIEKGEDNFYVVECPLFNGCYTQGRTIDEALRNIKEVIRMLLEEKKNRDLLKSYRLEEISLRTIAL